MTEAKNSTLRGTPGTSGPPEGGTLSASAMSPFNLHTAILFWKRQRAVSVSMDAAVYVISLAALCLAVLILGDWAFGFSKWARETLFVLACAVCARQAWAGWIKPVFRFGEQNLVEEIALHRPSLSRHIVGAWEFLCRGVPSNVSALFASEHINQTNRLVREEVRAAPKVFPVTLEARSKKMAGFALGLALGALLLGWNDPGRFMRSAWPFGEIPLERYIRIRPGNTEVPWASPVDIEARWLLQRHGSPELKIRTLSRKKGISGSWRNVSWTKALRNSFVYSISELTESIEYRMSFEGLESSRYRLSPRDFPHLKNERLKITFPAYTGKQPHVEFSLPAEMEVIRGSRVEISGTSDQKLSSAELIISEKKTRRKIKFSKPRDGARFSVSFPVSGDIEYFLSLVSQDEWKDPSPLIHRISARNDSVPSIELLSPSFEVEASPRDEVPVVYDSEDDFGIASIELVREVMSPRGPASQGGVQVRLVKSFAAPGPARWMGDAVLDLYGCPDGSQVVFYLRVRDHVPPVLRARPGYGESSRGRVSVVDFRKIHAELKKRMREMGQKARLLSEKEDEIIAALASSTSAFSISSIDELARGWESLANQAMENAVYSESDPYLNPGLLEQYRAIGENMKYLKENEVPPAMDLARKRDPRARQRHEKLRRELDRVSKSLMKGTAFQAMKDMETSAQGMESAGESLRQLLNEMAAGRDSALKDSGWRRLDKMMDKISKELQSLYSNIESAPGPEGGRMKDSEKKVFRVPVGAAMGLARMLSRAIAEKNLERAMALARALLERLGQARQALHEAAEYQRSSTYGEDAVSKKLEQTQALWREVTEEESMALSRSHELEDSMLKKMLKAQEKILDELVSKQGALVKQAFSMGKKFHNQTLSRMKGVLGEFKAQKIEKSPKELRTIISEISTLRKSSTAIVAALRRDLPRKLRAGLPLPDESADGGLPKTVVTATAAVASADISVFKDALGRIQEGEDEVLSLLEKETPRKQILSNRDMTGFKAAEAFQKKIHAKAGNLAGDLRELSRRAVAISPEISRRLGLAREEMEKAGAALGSSDGAKAISHQSKALEELDSGRKLMDESIRSQQSLESGMGQSVLSGRSVLRKRRGRTGMDTSPVKLPSSKDYKPPVRMREEIMESLQEKYPRSQKRRVTGYLKRLSE